MASRIGVIEVDGDTDRYAAGKLREPDQRLRCRTARAADNQPPATALFAGTRRGAQTVGAHRHLTIAQGAAACRTTVTRIEHLGDQSHLHLDVGGQPVVTLSDPEANLGAGDVVSLSLNNALYFDADGGRIAA